MASNAWEPVSHPTVVAAHDPPPSSDRSMPSARAPLSRRTPRSRKSDSSAAATSGSFCGSTCWRLTISVTSQPNDENMCTNSTPVTPEPMTTRCCGHLLRRIGVACGQDPLAVDDGPVRDAGGGSRWRAPPRRPRARWRPRRSRPRPVRPDQSTGPAMMRTPCDVNRLVTDDSSRSSISSIRTRSASGSTSPSRWCSPMPEARLSRASMSPVAIIALDGTQSRRCAAPPMTSRSISVTSAPSARGMGGAGVACGPTPDDDQSTRHRVRIGVRPNRYADR